MPEVQLLDDDGLACVAGVGDDTGHGVTEAMLQMSPVGRTATSTRALATSMPMKAGSCSMLTSVELDPHLQDAGSAGSGNRSGSIGMDAATLALVRPFVTHSTPVCRISSAFLLCPQDTSPQNRQQFTTLPVFFRRVAHRQPVPDAGFGEDVPGAFGGIAKLLAQPFHHIPH